MHISLIITTYNWPKALLVTLESISMQTLLPSEVIIADDGSTEETRTLINDFAKKSSFPIIHSWQEDKGFRLAKSRNNAIAKANYEYIILIDGDLLLHPQFIEDHFKLAQPNQFIIGPRALLDEESTNTILSNNNYDYSSVKKKFIRNAINNIHSNLLSKAFTFTTQSYAKVRGCNMSFFKEDLIKANGYNEDFIGWGREDTELVVRLLNNKIKRLNTKFNANTLHLYHKENSRKMLESNDIILKETIDLNKKQCKNGIKKLD